jgi:hypothetical protein
MSDGRLFCFGRVVGWLLVVVFGLTHLHPSFATALCGFPACEERLAIDQGGPACNGGTPGPSFKTGCACEEGPKTYASTACLATQVCEIYNVTNGGKNLVGSFNKCDCTTTGHPVVSPSNGFDGDPDGSCDAGCKIKTVGPSSCMTIGVKETCVATIQASGAQCTTTVTPPTPPTKPTPVGPCDPATGICVNVPNNTICAPDGVCVPSPRPTHGPDCGTDADSSLCAGTPENPNAPPPPAPDPPIPPLDNGQPPPPDVTIHIMGGCSGATCAPGQTGPIDVNGNNPPGGPTCPPPSIRVGDSCQTPDPAHCAGGVPPVDGVCPPDDGGSGTGDSGSQTCPDGSHPVNGRCQAPVGTCPGGAQPVNGHCAGDPGHCANGLPMVNGGCGGDGHCSNGQPPVSGVCPITCPNGQPPVQGQCQAPWGQCQDGSQPVNGTCTPGACDPTTDANHCEHGTASGGGTCGAAPSCNGDQILCATLNQTWRTRCALEGTTPAPDDGSGTHVPSEVMTSATVDGGMLDDAGFLGGGSCPNFGSVAVLTEMWNLGNSDLCSFLFGAGLLFQLICAFKAVRIAAAG